MDEKRTIPTDFKKSKIVERALEDFCNWIISEKILVNAENKKTQDYIKGAWLCIREFAQQKFTARLIGYKLFIKKSEATGVIRELEKWMDRQHGLKIYPTDRSKERYFYLDNKELRDYFVENWHDKKDNIIKFFCSINDKIELSDVVDLYKKDHNLRDWIMSNVGIGIITIRQGEDFKKPENFIKKYINLLEKAIKKTKSGKNLFTKPIVDDNSKYKFIICKANKDPFYAIFSNVDNTILKLKVEYLVLISIPEITSLDNSFNKGKESQPSDGWIAIWLDEKKFRRCNLIKLIKMCANGEKWKKMEKRLRIFDCFIDDAIHYGIDTIRTANNFFPAKWKLARKGLFYKYSSLLCQEFNKKGNGENKNNFQTCYLYYTILYIVKQKLIEYGLLFLDKLINFFEKYEKVLFLGERYRDHFIHSFLVYLQGNEILKTLKYRKVFNKYESIIDEVWFITAIFHDIAYPLQKIENWISKYLKDVFKDICPPESFLKWNNIIKKTFPKIKEDEESSTLKNLINNFRNSQYQNAILHALFSNKNHGILSAMLIYDYYYADDEKAAGNLEEILKLSTSAIALHDKDVWSRVNCKITFDKNPFAFLLMFCDHIQEWGRTIPRFDRFSSSEISMQEYLLFPYGIEKRNYHYKYLLKYNCELLNTLKRIPSDQKNELLFSIFDILTEGRLLPKKWFEGRGKFAIKKLFIPKQEEDKKDKLFIDDIKEFWEKEKDNMPIEMKNTLMDFLNIIIRSMDINKEIAKIRENQPDITEVINKVLGEGKEKGIINKKSNPDITIEFITFFESKGIIRFR